MSCVNFNCANYSRLAVILLESVFLIVCTLYQTFILGNLAQTIQHYIRELGVIHGGIVGLQTFIL